MYRVHYTWCWKQLNVLAFVRLTFLMTRPVVFVLRAEIEEFHRKLRGESRSNTDADRSVLRDPMAAMQGIEFERSQGCSEIHNSDTISALTARFESNISSGRVHLPQFGSFLAPTMAVHTPHRLPIVLGVVASLLFIIAAFHQRGGVPNAKKLWR
jgi:hypothetical protein